MTGEKIQKAREAARASLLTLRPTDRVGIIAFNDKFHWVAPLQTASDIPRLVRLVESISADGSTRIYPPLKAAFDEVLRDTTSLKHIILLTDGVSEQEGLPQLMLDAAAQHVTISTIGLGSDVLRNMLESLARSTQGHSYFVNAESDLPQVMSGDLQNAKTSLIKEGTVRALRAQPAEMTDGIQWNAAPPLLGFVWAKAKKGAETLVRLKSGEPLLVRWQYGLGHVVAFMSDARGRWAAPWVRWNSFGRLWPQVIRGVSNQDRNVHVDIRPGSNQGEEIVAYDLLNGADGDAATGLRRQIQHVILVQSPDNLVQPFALAETRPDHYEAQIAITKPGLYRVFSPQRGDVHLPETGFYYEPEQRKGTANRQLLSQIAELTGGRVSPTVEELLDRRGTLFLQARPVWPYILIAVLILNFFGVAIRRRLFQSRRLRPDRLSPQLAGMALHPISQPDAMPHRDYFQK
jgi:hypothetical protein